MKKVYLILLGLGISCSSPTTKFSPEITPEDISAHITYLASDTLKGRDTGSAEESIAANYIAQNFKDFGLEPLGVQGKYMQEFDVVKGFKEGEEGSSIEINDFKWNSLRDPLLAYAGSATQSAEGELVFVGYGIKAEDLKFNELSSNLKGKIVAFMRYGPDGESNPHSTYGFYWDLDKKIAALIAADVNGIIILDGPLYDKTELTLNYKRGKARTEIPIIQMSSPISTQLFESFAKMGFKTYQRTINDTKKPKTISTKQTIKLQASVSEKVVISRNVIAKIPGKSPEKGALIIGAHYDHLGMGGSGSLSGTKTPTIHNGADDNASGTAGVLELAHYFSTHKTDHDLIFMTFSGEEMGLLGSDYYANNPTYPMDSVRAMINMDMIGRLANRNLLIFGTGSASNWDTLITQANVDGLDIKKVPDGTGASDHTSFYNKGVSVLHYFTDTHSDYHKPSDDTEYINAFGEKMVLDHVARTINLVDQASKEDFYYTDAPVTQKRSVTMSGVTLGVIPDYGFRGEGMRITGVSEGRTGEKAGLKSGDIIIEIGTMKLKDIYDYMEGLNQFKKGEKGTLKVKRGEEILEFEVQF